MPKLNDVQLVEKLQSLIQLKAAKVAEKDRLIKEIEELEGLLVKTFGTEWPAKLKYIADFIENFGVI